MIRVRIKGKLGIGLIKDITVFTMSEQEESDFYTRNFKKPDPNYRIGEVRFYLEVVADIRLNNEDGKESKMVQ